MGYIGMFIRCLCQLPKVFPTDEFGQEACTRKSSSSLVQLGNSSALIKGQRSQLSVCSQLWLKKRIRYDRFPNILLSFFLFLSQTKTKRTKNQKTPSSLSVVQVLLCGHQKAGRWCLEDEIVKQTALFQSKIKMCYHLRGFLDLSFLTLPPPSHPRKRLGRFQLLKVSYAMRQSKYAVAWATVSTVVTVASEPLSPHTLFSELSWGWSSCAQRPWLRFHGATGLAVPTPPRAPPALTLGLLKSFLLLECVKETLFFSFQLTVFLVGTSRMKSEHMFGSILESLCDNAFPFTFLFKP